MIVESTSNITLVRVGGRDEDSLTETGDEHSDGNGKPEPRDATESGGSLHHAVYFIANGLFRVEDSFEEQDAHRGEDDVVPGQFSNPCIDLKGVQVGGQNAGGGLDHRQQGRKRDG